VATGCPNNDCGNPCTSTKSCYAKNCSEKYPNPASCLTQNGTATCPIVGGIQESTVYSGDLCVDGFASCGTACSTNCPSSNRCYLPETNNTNPSTPAGTYLCYGGVSGDDGKCYLLSQNTNAPTIVRAPQAGVRVYVKVAMVARPSGIRSTEVVKYTITLTDLTISSVRLAPVKSDYNYSGNLIGNSTWPAQEKYEVQGYASAQNKCDNTFKDSGVIKGYFKINTPPTVVSVTPNTGISGTYTDSDNDTMCVDHNPETFTVVYSDGDGASDITFAGLWVDNNGEYVEGNSGHSSVARGTWIKINAAGQCYLGCPDMQVSVSGTVLQTISVSAGNADYYVYSPTATSAKNVAITFTNDYFVSASQDRNLIINSISLGVSKSGGLPVTGSAFPISLVSQNQQFVPINNLNNSTVIGYTEVPAMPYFTFGLKGSDSDWIAFAGGKALGSSFQYCASGTNNDDTTYVPTCSTTAATAVSAVRSGNLLTVQYKIAFLSDIGRDLIIKGTVLDSTAFDIPLGTDTWTTLGTRTLDVELPIVNIPDFTVVDQNTLNLDWTISDRNDLIKTTSQLALFSSPYNIGSRNVKDITSNVVLAMPGDNNVDGGYVSYAWNMLSGFPYKYTVAGIKTWGRTETFDVSSIDAGNLAIRAYAVDSACNAQSENIVDPMKIAAPWFVTKGGFVYSDGNIIDPVIPDLTTPAFSIPSISPWTVPYAVLNNETNVSTELLLVNGNTTSALTWVGASSIYNPYTVTGYTYPNLYTQGISSYLWLKQNVNSITMYDISRKDLNASEVNITGNISDLVPGSTNDKYAIFSNQSLTLSNITCDKQALIMSDGNITLLPPINVDGSGRHGCIFVAGGNIVIGAGTHVSDDINKISKSEYINGYLVAGNQITILDVDSSLPVTDILEVRGGMVAFGEGGSSQSVMWNRSLRLKENMLYPTFGIHYDPRYLGISANFFDNSSAYVKDEGYKPY
jgi:hypothetical protein